MDNYILTNKAVDDLSEIWDYTYDVWSEKQADKYYNMLLEYCKELADKPSLGKNYNEVDNEIFGVKASHHIIFYKKHKEDHIKIVRILHNRMDLKAEFKYKTIANKSMANSGAGRWSNRQHIAIGNGSGGMNSFEHQNKFLIFE